MKSSDISPSLESIRFLAGDLLRESARKGLAHSLGAVLLFCLAAAVTCRLAFDASGGTSLFRSVGKTGVFALYLIAGLLTGSLSGAASALLSQLDRVRERVAAVLDEELLGKIPEERAAESMHTFRLQLKAKLSTSVGLRLLRVLPVSGSLVRSLETLGTSGEEIRNGRVQISETLAGTVVDDLRRQGNRARNFAFLLSAVLLAVPVLLALLRG